MFVKFISEIPSQNNISPLYEPLCRVLIINTAIERSQKAHRLLQINFKKYTRKIQQFF